MSVNTRINTSENRLGILIVVGSVFLLSISDAIVKAVNQDISMWQLYTVRSVICLFFIIILIYSREGMVKVIPQSLKWVVVRSLLLSLMWIAFYSALPFITLTMAALAIYTTPLFIALFSMVTLKENVNLYKWLAIIIGFIGVVVTLKPTADQFNSFTLLPILAAIFYALAAVVTKGKCTSEDPIVLAFGLNFSLFVIGVIGSIAVVFLGIADAANQELSFVIGQWKYMSPKDWVVLIIMAILTVLVNIGIAKAYQLGETSIIGAFDYTYLIFAVLWGIVFFGESISLSIVIGMILILISGFTLLSQTE